MYNKYKDIFKCIFIICDRYRNPLQETAPFVYASPVCARGNATQPRVSQQRVHNNDLKMHVKSHHPGSKSTK